MSGKDLAARAARMAAKGGKESAEEDAPAPIRAKPVSLTVSVQPTMYRFLKEYPDQLGITEVTGKARIATVEVIRAVLEEMMDDEALQRKVAKRVIRNVI